ncbi:MAG: chemotaxis protein CheW [Actinomycetota bacterium]
MTATQIHTGLQVCTFRLGELLFGVDVLDVQEVLYHADITPVPHAPEAVSGLINLRGQIATTLDLRTRLGEMTDDSDEPNPNPTHVVVRSSYEPVSLLVDRIGDVLDIEADRFEEPPPTMHDEATQAILGAYRLDDEILLILDVDHLIELELPTEES